MNGESALYRFLYQAIVSEIQSGRFRCGASLPSQDTLRRQYNVGITTVRRSLQMLQADGFIACAPRKRATVLYRADDRAYAASLLRYKPMTLSLYRSFEPVLPPLRALGAARLPRFDALRSLADSLEEGMEPEKFFQQVSLFFLELLAPFRNRVLADLQTDVSHRIHIPYPSFLTDESTGRLSPAQMRAAFHALLDALYEKDFSAAAQMLRAQYRGFMAWTERFFAALEQRYPDLRVEPLPQTPGEKTRQPLYTSVARHLYRRIQAGEFEGRRFIPSLPELMDAYGISQATALSAVALLSDIGVLQMHPKKGTSVARPGSPFAPVRLSRESILEHLILFLSALQILSCCAGCLSEALLAGLDEAERRDDAARLQSCAAQGSGAFIRVLLELFRRHAGEDCLARFITQLDDLLIWGHYLSRAPSGTRAKTQRLVAERFAALPGALERGELSAFSAGVGELFVLTYRSAYDDLLALGADPDRLPAPLDEAGRLA